MGARKSPKRTLSFSTASPTSTIRTPAGCGSLPSPRRRSTSQRSGEHGDAGSLPERSVTQSRRPSTPPRPANVPGNRGLAEEDERRGGAGAGLLREQRGLGGRAQVEARCSGPGCRTRPPGPSGSLRDPLDRLRDRAVLRHEGARAAAEDDRRARGDPEHDEDDRGAPPAQPRADEPEWVEHRPEQPAHDRATSSAATATTPWRRPVASWRSASGGPLSVSTRSHVPRSRAAGSTNARSSAV